MSRRQLIAFFVFSVAAMAGWSLFVQWRWPAKDRPARPTDPTGERLAYRPLLTGLPVMAGARSVPGAGLAGAWSMAAEAVTAMHWPGNERSRAKVAQAPEPPKPALPQKPAQEVFLGNDSFNLKAKLTTRGAGVQSLTLNAFEEADPFGLRAQPPRRLELIPDNPLSPSDLLYHYGNPEESRPDHPEGDLGVLDWELKSVSNADDCPAHEAVFSCEVPGQDVVLTKTYTLGAGDYHLGLTVRMERKPESAGPAKFRYQLAGAHGLPIEGEWYTTVYRNALIGLEGYQGKGIWRDLQTSQKVGYQGGGRDVTRPEDKFIRYAGVATQFFTSMIVVDDQQEPGVRPNFLAWARPTVEGQSHQTKEFLDDLTVRVVSEPVELKPGVPVVHKYLLYNGPVKVALLSHLEKGRAVQEDLVERYAQRLHLNTLTDYGSFGWWSDLIVFFTNVMHKLLWLLHTYVMPWSYGLSIILLTVVVRGLMFPLSRRQAAATVGMQERMQKINKDLAPEIKKLEEKYRNDPWQLRQAKHELYMKAGVNPMAMLSSCWLMVAQLPIFLGLYYALQESINFRLQPFLWVRNLSAPDMLAWWGEHIPFVSDPRNLGSFLYLGPFFNLLPIVWVVLMLIQQKIMTPPPADEQQAMQQKMMKYMMIPFFLFFYKVPAGLCVYWIGSILWSLGERKLLPKRPAPGVPAATPERKGAVAAPATRKAKGAEKAAKRDGNGTVQRMSDWWQEVLKQARKR
jgi:YidC/Oxa1 family membrane protein insertase